MKRKDAYNNAAIICPCSGSRLNKLSVNTDDWKFQLGTISSAETSVIELWPTELIHASTASEIVIRGKLLSRFVYILVRGQGLKCNL